MYQLIHRIREQARSHILIFSNLQNAQRPPEGGLCVV